MQKSLQKNEKFTLKDFRLLKEANPFPFSRIFFGDSLKSFKRTPSNLITSLWIFIDTPVEATTQTHFGRSLSDKQASENEILDESLFSMNKKRMRGIRGKEVKLALNIKGFAGK